ncbi:carboxypeptidase regulatory-like domain-containing protein [Daejeonella sp.]|uniref:carboxypeptidase regulatory-like domain-containing protein n=1 Tax=Daejeonella sp. TaxID=2805397 RepID=UPI0030BE9B26
MKYKTKFLIIASIITFSQLGRAKAQDLPNVRDSISSDSLMKSKNSNLVAPNNSTRITNLVIKGSLIDSMSQKPLEYITVNLKIVTDQSSKNTLSKNDGSFLFDNIALGKYNITIVAVGYKRKIIPLILDSTKQVWDLGRITITEDSTKLAEVVVTAARPLIKMDIDRISYDVPADPQSKVENSIGYDAKSSFNFYRWR